jgi:hypothetical protein
MTFIISKIGGRGSKRFLSFLFGGIGLRIIPVLALGLLLSTSSCASEPAANLPLIAPDREQGGVTAWVIQMPRQDFPPGNCYRDHLTEHLLGRLLFTEMDNKRPPFGTALDGQTSLDTITITIATGGGSDGIKLVRGVIEGLRTSGASGSYPSTDVRAAEVQFVQAEEADAPPPPSTLVAFLAAKPQIEAHAPAKCAALTWLDAARALRKAKILVVSEVARTDAASALQGFSFGQHERWPDGSVVVGQPASGPSKLFFVPVTDPASAIATIARIRTALGFEQARLAPVGRIGLTVMLAQTVEPERAARWSESNEPQAAVLQAAQATYCARIARPDEAALALAQRLSRDAWALASSESQICRIATTELARAKPQPLIPLASVPVASYRGANLQHHAWLTTCCVPENPGATGYFSRLVQSIATTDLRFRANMAQSVRVTPNGASLQIDVIDALSPGSAIAERLRNLATAPDAASQIERAQRDLCLSLSLEARRHNEDSKCERPASAHAIEVTRALLAGVK